MVTTTNVNSSVDGLEPKQPDGGHDGEPKTTQIAGDTPVTYSAYQKLLAEKRKLKEQHINTVSALAEYEAKEKQKEQDQLIADREFEKVLAEKNKAIEELSGRLSTATKNEQDYRKMHSFMAGLGSTQIDPKYFSLVPLDEIVITEEGDIDQASLVKVVKNFKSEHPRLLHDPRNPLPTQKVGGSGTGKLSVAEWKNLSTSKEQLARYGEVDWPTPG